MTDITNSEKSDAAAALSPATEEEKQLAQQSTNEFLRGSYAEAYRLLEKLAELRGYEPKVVHNQAVVKYYQSKLTQTDEFKEALKDVAGKCSANLDDVINLDDADHCVLFYNYAVLLFHLKQYNAALNIVDKLFQFLEPMEETLARKVGFLLIELYLITQRPDKAVNAVGFTEKNIFGGGPGKTSPEKEVPSGDEAERQDSSGGANNDIWRMKLAQYRARCCLMLKSLKACKRELKNIFGAFGTSATYMKANFEYLRGNYRKALKLLNSVPQPQHTMSSSPSTETGVDPIILMYYNDVAIVHFHLRKHNLGAFYFKRAIHENLLTMKEYNTTDPTRSLSGRPIHTVGMSRHLELTYNMGVELLHCGRPTEAFDYLLDSVQTYYVNPRLWLRIAECCIMVHRASNDEDEKPSKRLEIVQGTVGTGVHRKVVLGTGVQQQAKPRSDSSATTTPPALTLEFASLCLRNALALFPDSATILAAEPQTEQTLDGRQQDPLLTPAPPSNSMRTIEVVNLRCSVLVASAYVALCLGNPLMVLQYVEELLKMPKLSPAHQYLGHMYVAEALISLDRIADAIQHLNADNINDVSVVLPEVKPEQDKSEKNGDKDMEASPIKGALYPWLPQDLSKAKGYMQYNLATAHSIRGEHEKAIDYLTKSTRSVGSPMPLQMYYLRIYLELMEGRRKSALSILNNNSDI